MGTDWTGAICAQVDPEIFHSVDHHDIRQAKLICAGCPIKETCLQDALDNEAKSYRFGIWGGTTPEERDKQRRTQWKTSLKAKTGVCISCAESASRAPHSTCTEEKHHQEWKEHLKVRSEKAKISRRTQKQAA